MTTRGKGTNEVRIDEKGGWQRHHVLRFAVEHIKATGRGVAVRIADAVCQQRVRTTWCAFEPIRLTGQVWALGDCDFGLRPTIPEKPPLPAHRHFYRNMSMRPSAQSTLAYCGCSHRGSNRPSQIHILRYCTTSGTFHPRAGDLHSPERRRPDWSREDRPSGSHKLRQRKRRVILRTL